MSEQPIKVFLADDHNVVRQALAEMIARETDFEVVGQCGNGLAVVAEVLAAEPDERRGGGSNGRKRGSPTR